MNLGLRVISGAILIAVCAAGLWLGPPVLTALVVIVVLIAAWEVIGMARGTGAYRPVVYGVALVFSLHLLFGGAVTPGIEIAVAAAVAAGIIVFLRARRVPPWAVSVGLGTYVGLFGYFLGLYGTSASQAGHQGLKTVAAVLGGAILTDTGAYFAGHWLGRHKLAPAISPSKTIEGAIGGTLLCVIGEAIVAPHLIPVGVGAAVGLGLLVAVAGQLGDLCESALKRRAGIKDSSHLIPGHGGMLDRLDSLLFVAPVTYAYLNLVGMH